MIRRLVFGCCVLVALACSAERAFAQAPPYVCGPDCSTPGRYVLCNDNFDVSSTTIGSVVIDQFLEAVCTSFVAPAPTFTIEGFVALFGPGDILAAAIELYAETGGNGPGMSILDTGAGVPASTVHGFSGLLFGATPAITDFRLCIRQQIDDPFQTTTRPIDYDDDGLRAQNTQFIPGMGWQATTVPGDFIIRAIVNYNDLTPWGPGGVCMIPPPPDAGVSPDASPPPMDAGTPDHGSAMDTGMAAEDAAEDPDAGPSPEDAAPPTMDSGGPIDRDASTDDDAGGSVPLGPPMITAISPNEGSNATPVDVIVTGSGFVAGLSLKIGTISAEEVMVPGSTSINATVPANIAAGTYDVIVQNPDGQADVLTGGYTVTAKPGTAGVEDKCGCTSAASTALPAEALAALILLAFVRRKRRKSSAQRPEGA